jgi:hypothetical protein
LAEFKKEISVATAVAAIAAIGVGFIATTLIPTSSGTSTANVISTNSEVNTGPAGTPKALLGYMSAQNVSCSLATGACSVTLVNNSTIPVKISSCGIDVILFSNKTVTNAGFAQGKIGGPAAAGIPAGVKAAANCTVATSDLAYQTKGSVAGGEFIVVLGSDWNSFKAGSETGVSFEGTWS